MRTPHLPLPPPLPWSPTSHQFLRHLQILSLALMGHDAEESWRIYEALYPELRQAIPDDVFVSLVAHQASGESDERRSRLLDLLSVARSCGMEPQRLKRETILEILKAIMTAQPHDESWTPEAHKSLDWIWRAFLSREEGALRRSPLRMRQQWLELMSFRHRADLSRVHGALEELVENGGGEGITSIAARMILAQSKTLGEEGLRESLRLAAWCIARDVTIREQTIVLLLTRLRLHVVAEGRDGRGRARAAAEDLVRQLEEGGAIGPARQFQLALDKFLKASRSTREKAEDMLYNPQATGSMLRKIAEKLVRGEKGAVDSNLELAVRLCNRTLQIGDDEYESVLQTVLPYVSDAHRLDLAIALSRGALRSNVFTRQPISDRTKWALLDAALPALPEVKAYHVLRRLYQHARTEQHTWRKQGSPRLWRRFFDAAVSQGHIWFASRLYADFQADGFEVPRACMLSFINLVASRSSRSRTILLERHIKDYMYEDEHPVEPLVIAFTQGLVKTGAQDAAMAVHMAKRLSPDLPVRAVELVIAPLIISTTSAHRELAMRLLADVPPAEASRSYQLAITALVKKHSRPDLGAVLALYKSMTAQGVPVSVQIASALMTALLRGGYLESALSIFNAAADAKQAVKSSAIGRLMVNLGLKERCEEAYAAESRWRSLFPNGVDYDKGVRGARLLVDLKAGRRVDLSAFQNQDDKSALEHDGYKPTTPYLRFIESVQRDMEGVEESEASTEADSGVIAKDKLAARNLTPTGDETQQRWLFDPQRHRGRGEAGGRGGSGGVQMMSSVMSMS